MKIKPTIKKHPNVGYAFAHGHRLRSRIRCRYCKRSFNIAKAQKQGHSYIENRLDYNDEVCEASAQCRQCIESECAYYEKICLEMERNGLPLEIEMVEIYA